MTAQNFVEQLKARCKESGMTLTELCIQAKVNRSIVERWKKKEPKSFTILQRLERAMAQIEQEHSHKQTPQTNGKSTTQPVPSPD